MANSNSRIVVLGAGFGGLAAAQALRRYRAHFDQVTIVDRSNYHLFQPLLYQVATAGLSPADIAVPIRHELCADPKFKVLMAEVIGIDAKAQIVHLKGYASIPYDYLICATGARHSYFGHSGWEPFAPGLKTVSDALTVRKNILIAFEKAEMESDSVTQKAWLTFVIVGGGPTGVEVAGAIAELSQRVLRKDFRNIDPTHARILLVEAGPRVLPGFSESLSEYAKNALQKLGVEVQTGSRVSEVTAQGAQVGPSFVSARTVIWAAGVIASPVGKWLGIQTDPAGRVPVGPDLSVSSLPRVYVIGDASACGLPGVAPVAMQQGRFVAALIGEKLKGRQPGRVFKYKDKGSLATIGRRAAVGEICGIRLQGTLAWLVWALIHVYSLVGFRNRILVLIQWLWAYVTFQRGARIIQEK